MGATTIGVVGDAPAAVDALEAAGASVVAGDPSSVVDADPALVVVAGEAALLAVARERPSAPVLPLAAGRGVASVAPSTLADRAEAVLDGDFAVASAPLLGVAVAGDRVTTALFDVSLVPEAVARISEYRLTADGERVDQFRADGVVLATPVGSTGYARRVGAPVVDPGTDDVAVAPIAPFATNPDRWILPLGTLGLEVLRDEVGVQLLADDRSVASVAAGDRVTIIRDGSLSLATLADGGA